MVTDSEYLLEKCSYQFVLDNEELEHNEMLRSISDKLARYEKALRFYLIVDFTTTAEITWSKQPAKHWRTNDTGRSD